MALSGDPRLLREFQQKAHLHPLLGRVLDLQAESQSEQQQDAATVAQVANGQPAVAQEPAVELGAEAAELYAALQARIGEETHVGEWLHVSQQMIDQFAAVTGDHQWIPVSYTHLTLPTILLV